MNLLVISTEFPYPPNHGGRVDTWRRLQAFKECGVEIFLICWYWNEPCEEDLAQVLSVVKVLKVFPINHGVIRNFRRFLSVARRPLSVGSRSLSESERKILLKEAACFNPKAIFLDGIWGGEICTYLSKRLCKEYFVRSHNIEHIYMRRQAKIAKGVRLKLKLFLSVLHLRRYERKILSRAARVYDISCDDLVYWKNEGIKNIEWLPPVMSLATSIPIPGEIRNKEFDVVYLGNLSAPNNLEGLYWFLTEVVPIVSSSFPSIKICISGSSPSQKTLAFLESFKVVSVVVNPPSAQVVLNNGRCLVNPILNGSGVNIKSVEMLSCNTPVVSTPQGVAGLPLSVVDLFRVAVTPQDFASELLEALSEEGVENRAEVLEENFGVSQIQRVVSYIDSFSE